MSTPVNFEISKLEPEGPKSNMKKFSVCCKIDGMYWDQTIEADQFSYSKTGVYEFKNTETDEIWYFPIHRTVIKRMNT